MVGGVLKSGKEFILPFILTPLVTDLECSFLNGFVFQLLQRYSVSLESSDEKLPFHYTIFATPSRKFSVLLQKRKNRNV